MNDSLFNLFIRWFSEWLIDWLIFLPIISLIFRCVWEADSRTHVRLAFPFGKAWRSQLNFTLVVLNYLYQVFFFPRNLDLMDLLLHLISLQFLSCFLKFIFSVMPVASAVSIMDCFFYDGAKVCLPLSTNYRLIKWNALLCYDSKWSFQGSWYYFEIGSFLLGTLWITTHLLFGIHRMRIISWEQQNHHHNHENRVLQLFVIQFKVYICYMMCELS